MSEYKLIGHETYLQKFVTLYKNNELPNKILLSGKKGIGKSLLAEKFLYKIFNSNNDYELCRKIPAFALGGSVSFDLLAGIRGALFNSGRARRAVL